ncbi:HTTM domain-containing protein [Phytoactinopolyspora limicola]|uniref:HTTM domain-containing protein n=1 Tax=Phytoactinopolyspora limicola TaxID=2715536 RepID=UPI00140CCBD8|nr:HTTM domain-containing protein [Phytoactinopolyspora limicola]
MSARTPVLWNDHVAPKLRFGEDWLLGAKRATYGLAMMRILFGLTALGFLAANWLNRHYLWGDAARWLEPIDDNGGFSWPFTFFRGGSSQLELDLKLGLVAVLLVLLVLGWRTRILAPIILILWVSLIEAQPIYGDQSDNIFRILFFYMCFADTSGRWSLDARRRARRVVGQTDGPIRVQISPQLRTNTTLAAVVFHNFAVVAIAVQVCIIYLASGLYKVQGELWQDGTAVYYPMQVGQYAPWPALNELLSSSALGVMVVTYFSVFIQIFFPLMLLRRTSRIVALVGVTAMHLGIAVVMGLPFFSLFILAGDMIFIRDVTWRKIGERVLRTWDRAAIRFFDAIAVKRNPGEVDGIDAGWGDVPERHRQKDRITA